MDDIGDTIGDKVPRGVKARLSNFRQIARISGLSRTHVSRVLSGSRGATIHVFAVIAQAADVRLDHLYNFVISQPGLKIRTRKTRKPRARSVMEPIEAADGFPEKPEKPAAPIPHKKRYDWL